MNSHFGITLEVDFSKPQWRFGLLAHECTVNGSSSGLPSKESFGLVKGKYFQS